MDRERISVRRLDPSEWEVLRDIRVEALVESPGAFLADAEIERVKPEAEWRSRTARSVVAFRGERPVGLAGWVSGDGDEPVAELVGMWVRPTERGGAAAVELLRFVQRAVGVGDGARLELGVFPDNRRAVRFYERCGFEAVGEYDDPRAGGLLLCMRLVGPGSSTP